MRDQCGRENQEWRVVGEPTGPRKMTAHDQNR
jgi:hypothetical protein